MTYMAGNCYFKIKIFEALLIITNKITLLWAQAYKLLHSLSLYIAPWALKPAIQLQYSTPTVPG